jgi:hypothetical protein
MSQLAKTVIHNQVNKLAGMHYIAPAASDSDRRRGLSKAFALLCVMQLLEVDEESAVDAVVDGQNDMGIDAIWVEEPQSEYFNVHLFQTKYTDDLDKDKGFPENEVVKIINSLRMLLRKNIFNINDSLDVQLSLVKSHIDEFNIPNFTIYLANNGHGLSHNAQAHIDAFLAESPENVKRYRFKYVNHVDIFRATERAEPVNCALEFAGGFVDEAINYKRAFVGKVQVTQIAELLNKHDDQLLGRNVRDFLGFRRAVNEGIKDTLENPLKCKDFYFLNNGITFVCQKLDYAQGANGARARLSNAQIINGGQTSRTIQSVVAESPGTDFSQTFVLVRAYQVDMDDEGDFIHDITTATNSQNAIFARDLHANDPVQRRLEVGLKHYSVRYLRRRDHRRAKPEDIRMEVAAECLVTVLLHKPVDAKYRKSLHFTQEFYPEIFDEKRITPELVLFVVSLFKRIESARKHASAEVLQRFPFIPMASHFVLLVMHPILTANVWVTSSNVKDLIADLDSSAFAKAYESALQLISEQIQARTTQEQVTDALIIAQMFRNEAVASAAWAKVQAGPGLCKCITS